MADPVKVLQQEITLGTTPNNISLATLVRVVNSNDTELVKITQRDASNNVISDFTLSHMTGGFSDEFIIKQPTDTLESNAASGVLAVSVGYY